MNQRSLKRGRKGVRAARAPRPPRGCQLGCHRLRPGECIGRPRRLPCCRRYQSLRPRPPAGTSEVFAVFQCLSNPTPARCGATPVRPASGMARMERGTHVPCCSGPIAHMYLSLPAYYAARRVPLCYPCSCLLLRHWRDGNMSIASARFFSWYWNRLRLVPVLLGACTYSRVLPHLFTRSQIRRCAALSTFGFRLLGPRPKQSQLSLFL